MSPKVDDIRRVAINLLDDLETGDSAVEGILMKAKRLARLMRDTDAQTWLDFETRGYSSDFRFSFLGTCEKYARSGRELEGKKYFTLSLPELDARCHSTEMALNAFEKSNDTSKVMENFTVKRATEEFLAGQMKIRRSYEDAYKREVSRLVAIKSSIHSYATDSYLAIELGDIAQNIFEKARADVDTFVRAHCPKGAQQLIAINERMAEESTESRAAALTSCRRLLLSLADSLFPAETERTEEPAGKARRLGPDQYKNRLLAYLETSAASDGSQEVVASDLKHLAARLDALYAKTSKGVHADVSEREARLAVIHTYLFIGELAAATQT